MTGNVFTFVSPAADVTDNSRHIAHIAVVAGIITVLRTSARMAAINRRLAIAIPQMLLSQALILSLSAYSSRRRSVDGILERVSTGAYWMPDKARSRADSELTIQKIMLSATAVAIRRFIIESDGERAAKRAISIVIPRPFSVSSRPPAEVLSLLRNFRATSIRIR